MKKTLLTLCIVSVLFLTLIQFPTSIGGGIGVGPAKIKYHDAHRGQTYSENLFFYNDDYDNRTVNITLSGNITNWNILFYHSINLTNPITFFSTLEDTMNNLTFIITIPDNITVGTYQGKIIFNISKLPGESFSINLVILVNITVNIIADFWYTPKNATTEDTIQFFDNTTYLKGPITMWSWDFGDGHTSFLQNPQNQYITSGEYIVTLNVTLSNGYYDEISQTISIQKLDEQDETDDNDKTDGTPGFELIPVILAIALVLFWKRKKSK